MYASFLPPAAPPVSPLLTERLTLRPYQATDEAAFFALLDQNRRRLQQAFPSRVAAVQTPPDAGRVLAQFAQDWRTGRLYVFGIWHTATGSYLGDISLRPSWQKPISAEIGYYLGAEAEGRGYAREALAAAVQFGFGQHVQAASLTLRCRRDNPRSMAVAEHAGFQPLTTRRRLWALRTGDHDIVQFRLER
ncbi:GNAT family N-acetyltransferase [Hymenobacter psychrotolerans]|uniref:Protein N-acetyltransferase, RimJ/RimL family n=1 Tax=Hymenobacter psychrotolerans DSM 18569 TaxID=1121959 RepID=A0A1M6RPU2_9BACT|nr:GNAT family N-acetyltransferase [Hymenobacter psychrotolerans]SHK34502.1 Protein N-acetyltransferase, RimJ/RimL family [Hymenobacter psychrotolerans DSM 18569]